MPSDHPPDDRSRAAVLVLSVVATVAVVSLAATGAGLLVPAGRPGEGAALLIRLGGGALALVGLAALVTPWGRGVQVARPHLEVVLAAAVTVLAGVALLTWAFSPDVAADLDRGTALTTDRDRTGDTTGRVTTTSTEADETTTTMARPPRPLALEAPNRDLRPVITAMALLVALAIVSYLHVRVLGNRSFARWWRPATGLPDRDGVPIDAASAEAGLEASLDAVTGDSAPRDAISDAYARLLAALDGARAGRRPQEAPHEHLDRVLGPLGVRSAPLHRLAELFVLARFSQHPITDRHRRDAGDALRQALADLRAAEARHDRRGAGATS